MKNIVVLAFDGAQVLDITGPMEVFALANQFACKPIYRVECLGVPQANIRVSSGLTLSLTRYSSWRGPIDTLVVPGGSVEALEQLRTHAQFPGWLSARLGKARRVVSVCTGAFVLAELGFLQHRKATTHWNACDRLQDFAPTTQVQPDAIFTKDDNVYTSAGVTTGIDLALSLVEEDAGKEVSLDVARHLVMLMRRSASQPQHSVPLQLQQASQSRVERIVGFIQSHPSAALTVEALAGRFGMSGRHLSRIFRAELGMSPAKFIEKVRIEAAKQFLVDTRLSVQAIADRCGFDSQSNLSRAFKRCVGISPSAFRAHGARRRNG